MGREKGQALFCFSWVCTSCLPSLALVYDRTIVYIRCRLGLLCACYDMFVPSSNIPQPLIRIPHPASRIPHNERREKVPPDGDFAAATAEVASLVYLCKPEEGCLTDQDWESSSHK